MGDACSNPPTPDGVYKMLIKNFERHYTTNRSVSGSRHDYGQTIGENYKMNFPI